MDDSERQARLDGLMAAFREAGAQEPVEPKAGDYVRVIAKYSYELDDAGSWVISKWTPDGDGWEGKSLGEWSTELLDRASRLGLGLSDLVS